MSKFYHTLKRKYIFQDLKVGIWMSSTVVLILTSIWGIGYFRAISSCPNISGVSCIDFWQWWLTGWHENGYLFLTLVALFFGFGCILNHFRDKT